VVCGDPVTRPRPAPVGLFTFVAVVVALLVVDFNFMIQKCGGKGKFSCIRPRLYPILFWASAACRAVL